jgi:uncharacterized repeat protein (TIGR04076 family)
MGSDADPIGVTLKMASHDLEVRVVEIKGRCPVYRVGDRFRISEGYKLQAERPVCLHALSALMPYYVALSRGTPPRELGLGNDDTAYLQCLDPYERTGGGTVVFAVRPVRA